ncbi:MAG: hypothetical protein OIF47_12065 [Marinibacterium sp.]|nr:hypothetical protein [Marinibacterium sp.]
MGKALWNLLVALINATLILLALCLFLGWKVVSTVDDLRAGFAQSIAEAVPVTGQLQDLRSDIAGIRSDLQSAIAAGGDTTAMDSALSRVIALETRANAAITRAEEITDDPSALVDQAITSTAAALTQSANDLRGCTVTEPLAARRLLPAQG